MSADINEYTVYCTAIKSGVGIQVRIPIAIVRNLQIKNRDEIKLVISKTGNFRIYKQRLTHKNAEFAKRELPIDLLEPNKEEWDFINKYKLDSDPVALKMAIENFSEERVNYLLKNFIVTEIKSE